MIKKHVEGYSTKQAAKETLRAIQGRTVILSKFPYSGPIDPHFEFKQKGHRFVMVGHFRIVYRVIDDKIHITNVFDSRMNPKDVFFVGE